MGIIVRYAQDGGTHYGLRIDGHIEELSAAPWQGGVATGRTVPLDEVDLICPAEPQKILAAAVNYESHAIRRPPPEKPELFFKPTSCLLASGGSVVLPSGAGKVDAEAELVVVIGKRGKRIDEKNALDYVAGYLCGLDISARVWQRSDRSFWRAKGSDTFGPVGEGIATEIDIANARLVNRINGEVRQEAALSELIFGVPQLVSFASQSMTLAPGDLIFTGTPSVTPEIFAGDRIEVEIDGLPKLVVDVVGEESEEKE